MADSTTTRWRRIETLFYHASEMDATKREAFIEQQCAGDVELRAELDSLLASSDVTLTALSGQVAEAAGGVLLAEQEETTRIGAYRLIRTLGEGGMGTVYLGARDDDQFNRIVAIKVLRAGLSHRPELQLLFRTERQILADFDHPYIARLLDGGITPQGAPYLVMEYIEGEALDVYCQQRKLGLDARLRLFRMLCTAVDYAHRHLVIHRDIKPMNVLVTADGTPKLLDFGIAKLIDPYQSPTEQVLVGGHEQMLTPDYASPEQILGRPISTATDVYALGVLLFELLTGELPSSASQSQTLEQGSRGETEKASTICLKTRHLASPDAKRIRGDLDSIIVKATRQEPEQRYSSASQLLADLDRYRKGLVVEAVAQSLAYRARKFIWRHRISVAVTALSVLLLVGFATAMAVLARRASLGEAKALREKEFLASIFDAATPEGSEGENVTARQLLDRAAGRLDAELGSNAELQADMAENVGESYVALGMYDRAQPLLERAEQLAAEKRDDRSPVHLEYLSNLATDYRLQGQFKKAEPLFRRAVELNDRLHGSGSVAVAHSLSNLGECLYLEDKDGEAEQTLRRALAIERPLPDSQQDGTRSYLALTIERRGAYSEAAQLLREFIEIEARIHGTKSSDYLVALHNLAGAQIDMGDLEGAIKSDKEVLATRQKIWGMDHPDTAYSLNNLGWIYLEEGRWDLAEPFLKQNLQVERAQSQKPGPRYATSLANWGRLLEQKGDYAAAGSAYEQSQQILAANGQRNGWIGAKIEVYQSLHALDQDRFADAVRIAEHAVKVDADLGGNSSPQLSAALSALGMAQLLGGDASAAEVSFRKSLAMRKRFYQPGHFDLLLAQVRLAEALLAGGRVAQALAEIESAIAAAKAAPFPLPSWRMAEMQIVNGIALRDSGRVREGAALTRPNLVLLKGYNQPAMKKYLMIRASSAERNVRARQTR